MRDAYCRFTGGGDIFVQMQEMSLVIANMQKEEDNEGDPSLPSPRNVGDYIAGFTIKGKKLDCSSNKTLQKLSVYVGTAI